MCLAHSGLRLTCLAVARLRATRPPIALSFSEGRGEMPRTRVHGSSAEISRSRPVNGPPSPRANGARRFDPSIAIADREDRFRRHMTRADDRFPVDFRPAAKLW
jgi:hypothetical protein